MTAAPRRAYVSIQTIEGGSILAVQSQYDDWQIIEALREEHGDITAVARRLEVKRASIRDRIQSTPELKEARDEARDGAIDKAEANIFAAVENKDLEASKFVLRTIGKDRGYVYGQQISGDPEHPLYTDNVVNIIGVAPTRDANGKPIVAAKQLPKVPRK